MHKLIIEDDEGRTTVVPLIRDELTIGRKEGNTIRLTERNVSRRHARLFKRDGSICIEDLGSFTGIRVNGTRIGTPASLQDRDQVMIGDYKLSVRSDATVEAIPTTTPGVPTAVAARDEAALNAASLGDVGEPSDTRTGAPSWAATPAANLDASPTIPLLTLEERERAANTDMPGAIATPPARLVLVTGDMAGREFSLDRASAVIGRTEENEIIIDHPSISRHHAKVVRDGDRYTIVDLQSANGVRVAGESYERVEVQPGDVVELGHVKLRFVGPSEDWVFDRREFTPPRRGRLKLAAVAIGLGLAGLLVFALQSKGSRTDSHKAATPKTPGVDTVPRVPPPGPSQEALFSEAAAAARGEDWDKAVTALDLLLSQPRARGDARPLMPEAVELKRKVDFERRSADIFAAFQKAVADREPDVALSRYDQISPDSVYKARAEPALGEVKSLSLAAHLELADGARIQGRCDEAAAEVEKVQQLEPDNRQARDILRKCRVRPLARMATSASSSVQPVAGGTASGNAPSPPPALRQAGVGPGGGALAPSSVSAALVARTVPRAARSGSGSGSGTVRARTLVPANTSGNPTSPTSPTSPASVTLVTPSSDDGGSDAADLIKQAREAWMRQQCGAATELSRRALKLKPSSNDAHQILAVCACSSRDKEGAARSYGRLDERSRGMVRTLCARNGVELLE